MKKKKSLVVLLILLTFAIFSAGKCENSEIPTAGTTTYSTALYSREINTLQGPSWFSFVQLTDLHIGESIAFNYSFDHATPPPAGSDGDHASYLRSIVEWINNNKDTYNIKFVIVTGDITDTAALWQFLKAKEILENLTIPYIPMMGNHDVWPNGSTGMATGPTGDTYFRTVFGPVLDSLSSNPMFTSWDNGTRNTAVTNPEPSYACSNYYQNFSFSYGGYDFMCADFNARYKQSIVYNGVTYYTGAGVKGELTYTWGNWFQTKYNSIPKTNNDRILIFSHIPAVSWSHPTTGVQYGFEPTDLTQITDFLYNNDNANDTGLWAGGHFHTQEAYNYYQYVYTSTYNIVSPQVLAQTSENGKIQLITCYNN